MIVALTHAHRPQISRAKLGNVERAPETRPKQSRPIAIVLQKSFVTLSSPVLRKLNE